MNHAPASAPGGTREEILRRAIVLFARNGYTGVSMRDVAAGVGISAAALYHHFADKQALYIAAMQLAFERSADVGAALDPRQPPVERLRVCVERLVDFIASDENLRLLVMREMIDGDEDRLAQVADQVFREAHGVILALARELATDLDPYLLANSIICLVLFSLQSAPLRRHLRGGRAQHEKPATIAAHITTLLTRACATSGGSRP